MSKIADYLNQHLVGDVVEDAAVRQSFSTDGSILRMVPHLVVYPRVVDDVRKIARFTWRLAERGQVLPLTPRGMGTDVTGGAITNGVILSFPAYMSQIMEFDLKSQLVRVQPGIRYSALKEAMATHGLMLPVVTGNSKAETIGGMLGSNSVGDGFSKYGMMRDWVDKLEVVLANGEIIQTGRISRKELSLKKGQETLEGEIYRSVDNLIEDESDLVDKLSGQTILDSTNYALDLVKNSDGSFDLTPLFLGSQGTLGVITQVILKLDRIPSETSMIVAAVTDNQNISDLVNRLVELEPSSLTFIDGETLELMRDIDDYEPWTVVTNDLPKGLIFIEFDDKHQTKRLRKAAKILDSAEVNDAKVATDVEEIESLYALRDALAVITRADDNGTNALPLATDLAVAPENVFDAVDKIRESLSRNHIKAGVWGNLGAGLISVRPLLNLANLGQRQVLFRLMKDLTAVAAEYSGSLTGAHGEGRFLAPFIKSQQDKAMVDMNRKLRKIFDPFGTLNTGVKSGASKDYITERLRQDYRQCKFYDYNLRG